MRLGGGDFEAACGAIILILAQRPAPNWGCGRWEAGPQGGLWVGAGVPPSSRSGRAGTAFAPEAPACPCQRLLPRVASFSVNSTPAILSFHFLSLVLSSVDSVMYLQEGRVNLMFGP